jgi:hypothetical protein
MWQAAYAACHMLSVPNPPQYAQLREWAGWIQYI